MTLRQTLPVHMMILALLLTGCFRSADDNFESIDGLDSPTGQSVDVSPTAPVTLLEITEEPDSDTEAMEATDDVEPIVDAQAGDDSTEDVIELGGDITPTETVALIIASDTPQPATDTPIPLPTEPDVLPTATDPIIITPEPPPSQLDIDTPVPIEATEEVVAEETQDTVTSDAEESDSPDTPTEDTISEECQYVVQNGDNPFRIALTNDVTLAELLAANNLPNDPILQPGQTLLIPNCTADDADTAEVPAATDDDVPQTDTSGDFITHVVTSGETLSAIAARYGVSVAQIVAENDLVNPDSLSVGQQLRIPN